MRTTTAVIATLALLCVGATGVVAQETDEVAPAAEPSVYFTGTFENTGLELPDPSRTWTRGSSRCAVAGSSS